MESTPNPSVMKFVANRILVDKNIELFKESGSNNIGIADALFNFPFIQSIFLSGNFISIKKDDSIEWEEVAMQIRVLIVEKLNEEGIKNHAENFISNRQKDNLSSQKENTYTTETEKEIAAILEQYIKPAVEADGGYISLKSFKEGIVTVSLKGACSGCPSSTITLKQGVENLLKQKIGDVIKDVVADQD